MCGRYYMSDDTIWEIERRTGAADQCQGRECPAEEDLLGQRAEQVLCDPGKRIL